VKSVSLHSSVQNKKRATPLLHLSVNAPVHAQKQQKKAAGAEVYCLPRTPVDFYSFDEEYLSRLGARDPATEAHFVAYFTERLKITLRARGVDAHTIEDIRQETFCRVWMALLAGGVNNPRGFGAYVHSVCRNVLSESRRGDHRNQHDSLEFTDVPDGKLSLEDLMQRKENERLVRAILSEMTARDRQLLQARFFEDRDNDEVCEDFRVDRNYLRVLLHRATNKFGELYRKKSN
jgi:RNA polymerase sigma factor (sigma-70 family)